MCWCGVDVSLGWMSAWLDASLELVTPDPMLRRLSNCGFGNKQVKIITCQQQVMIANCIIFLLEGRLHAFNQFNGWTDDTPSLLDH